MTPDERGAAGALAIVGTGLMGTSIALAAARAEFEIRGFDPDRPTAQRAADRAGFEVAGSAAECAHGADVVFVCAPLPAIPDAVQECLAASPDAVVSDVGSVKSGVVQAVEARAGEGAARFVGGHPMAGSERSGPDAASAALLEGAAWVLTPGPSAVARAVDRLERVVAAVGARPVLMSPERHDRLVAVVSHLPQVVSTALMALAAREQALDPELLDLSAGGFRDLTRLAASNPELWGGILRANREAVTEALDRFVEALGEVRGRLAAEDGSLEELFEEGRRARLALGAKPQVRAGLALLQVSLDDRPGVLASLTGALGEGGVNIEDLQLVHLPEGGRGTAHVTVALEDAGRAGRVVTEAGFDAIRLA